VQAPLSYQGQLGAGRSAPCTAGSSGQRAGQLGPTPLQREGAWHAASEKKHVPEGEEVALAKKENALLSLSQSQHLPAAFCADIEK